MKALYNEIEPYAAKWLENLAAKGHITDGKVDRRSIVKLLPEDVAGYTRAHFFAGIGVWDYALRLAGWPVRLPVWTGSCPCQPFSQAGTGGGFADKRHLWPAWFKLIRVARPPVIFGEQVASPDGLEWLDAVFADLEGEGYACGAADLCAAGVGAPHIRQRLFFVAYAPGWGLDSWGLGETRGKAARERSRRSEPSEHDKPRGTLADPDGGRREKFREAHDDNGRDAPGHDAHRRVEARLVGDASGEGLQARQREVVRGEGRGLEGRAAREPGGAPRGVGDAGRDGARQHAGELQGDEREHEERGAHRNHSPLDSGATRGFWAGADWLPCTDGVARPVEPGTFPLAHGVANRVGKLRAYGNAINAEAAALFVEAVMDVLL